MTPTRAVLGVVALFVVLALSVFFAAFIGLITVQLALLLLVALLGMYLGFGVLVAVWRFTSKLK